LDKWDDRKWLFTSRSNDLRGNLAGKAFLNVLNVRGSQAAEFMDAKNYENKGSARDGEVHKDFVQFIVDAALHAKAIDPAIGNATVADSSISDDVGEVVKSIQDGLDDIYALNVGAGPANVSEIATVMDGLAAPGGIIDPMITMLFNQVKGNIKSITDLGASFKVTVKPIITKFKDDVKNHLVAKARVNSAFVTLSNNQAKTVYDNVFARWSELTDDAKKFYDTYIELQKKGALRWEKASEFEYATAGSNPSNFRLNLKKNNAGITFISRDLVQYDATVFGGVWVNNKLISPASGPIFGTLFQEIYKGEAPSGPFDKLTIQSSSDTKFNVQVDDLIRNRFYAISKAAISDGYEMTDTQNYKYLDMINQNIITRDSNGKFMRTINGIKVEYGKEDAETIRALKASHNCYGTYVNAKDEATCKRYIFECLLSQDPDALDKCIKNIGLTPDFFKVATDDIRSLHPVLALRILQQFGFQKYKEQDSTSGMQLWKVESVSNWLKTVLKPKYPNLSDMLAQPGQRQILEYLDLVSQYVNANPAILNKSYVGSSDEAMGNLEKKKSEYGRRLGLEWEIPKGKSSFVLSDIGRLRGHLQQLKMSRSNPFYQIQGQGLFTPFGKQFTPGMTMLQGGGGSKCELVIKKLNENSQVSGYQVIKNYMNAVLNDFSNKNKILNPTDKKNIENNLEKYRELEHALLKSLCYIDEFNSLSDMLQDYDTKMLTEDNLKKFVDRLSNVNGKIQSTETQLLDIIMKIQDVIGTDGPKTPVKAGDWI